MYTYIHVIYLFKVNYNRNCGNASAAKSQLCLPQSPRLHPSTMSQGSQWPVLQLGGESDASSLSKHLHTYTTQTDRQTHDTHTHTMETTPHFKLMIVKLSDKVRKKNEHKWPHGLCPKNITYHFSPFSNMLERALQNSLVFQCIKDLKMALYFMSRISGYITAMT